MNIREAEEYKSGFCKIVICPVCKNETLDMHWICENCNWEYDGITDENAYSAANRSTVKGYKTRYFDELLQNRKNALLERRKDV